MVLKECNSYIAGGVFAGRPSALKMGNNCG